MGGLFGKTTTIDNGRVAGFAVNEATYGKVVPIILGTSRQSANIIDYYKFTTIKSSTTTGAGKGGAKTKTINYAYKAAVLLGLGEGPISGIDRVWVDTDEITTLTGAGLTMFSGAAGQAVWAYTETEEPTHALPYSGLAYVAGYIDLDSNASLKQYNFEVKGLLLSSGDGVDVNPGDASEYILLKLGFSPGNILAASLTNFKDFCAASDMLVTVPLTDTAKAYEIINRLCEMNNTIVFWSQSKMKFVPRCEQELAANGVTYTPNTTPEYDLTADDFLPMSDGQLVTWSRKDNAETYNQAFVEFTNRAADYESETVNFIIQADASKRGIRPMSSKSYKEIHTKARAEYVAQMVAMESCYGRNTYTFRLGAGYPLLEPGDIVTLTDTAAGLNRLPVQIETYEEDGDENYKATAKFKPFGIYSPARYTVFDSIRGSLDRNMEPGATEAPLFFETPFPDGTHKIGIAVCGVDEQAWGGAGVWLSFDGTQYTRIGEVNRPGRYGTLVTGITNVATAATVQMIDTTAQLLSASAATADANATLICIGNEWMTYETATLVSAGRYTLSGIVRARFGTTAVAHLANETFLRYDPDGFLYPYQISDVGRLLYIKLTAKNVFGINEQDLTDATEYTYTIQGAGSLSRIEQGPRSIVTPGWTAFTFAESFSAAPTFFASCTTVGGVVYWRNVTATGFEANILNSNTQAAMAGDLTYQAQGW